MSNDTNERQTMPPPRVPIPKAVQGQPVQQRDLTLEQEAAAQLRHAGEPQDTRSADRARPGRPPKADAFDLTCAIAKELKRVDREMRLRILDTLLALMG
jgi:hypothetical protein